MANEKRLIDANELCLGKFPNAGMSDYKNGWNDALDAATTQAPTVDAVEVVHGRWEQSGDFAMCSECFDLFKEREVTVFRYCPNCGAKMDGDGNDI